MKICKRCGIEKELTLFGKNIRKKDGLDIYCKECKNRERIEKREILNSNSLKFYIKNKDIINEKKKLYRKNNKDILKKKEKNNRDNFSEEKKDKIKEISKIYYQNNKEKLKLLHDEYRKLNKEKLKEQKKEYYLENKKRVKEYQIINKVKITERRKIYEKNNKNKKNEYKRNKIKNDPLFAIKCSLRSRINICLRKKGIVKTLKTIEILGCSFKQFYLYLESKFDKWMNWGNYGKYNGELDYGWDIDHIIPLCVADNEEKIIELNHFTNLQPLCSYINRHVKRNFIL